MLLDIHGGEEKDNIKFWLRVVQYTERSFEEEKRSKQLSKDNTITFQTSRQKYNHLRVPMQTQKVDKKYYKQADQNKKRGNNQENIRPIST